MAAEIGAAFVFAERLVSETGAALYRIPESLHTVVYGKRALLADDAVNAGSALLATCTYLLDYGAKLVVVAALLTLDESAARIAE